MKAIPLTSATSAIPLVVEAVPSCSSCKSAGVPLYGGLRDQTFGSPGEWSLSRCPRCGLVWLDPRPVPDEIGKVYQEYYTHSLYTPGDGFVRYGGGTGFVRRVAGTYLHASRRLRERALAASMGYEQGTSTFLSRAVNRAASLVPGVSGAASFSVLGLSAHERGRLLDVGCGNGMFLARMAELGWQGVGLETDGRAAEFARSRFGLEVVEGTLEQAGFPDGAFDAVVLSHVIEHVYDPVATLAECGRVLRPGGKLVVLTPNTRSLGHRIFRSAWRGLEPPRHLHIFDRRTLREAATRAGLGVAEASTISRMMQGIWYMSRLIQRANAGGAKRNTLADYLGSYAMRLVESVLRLVWKDAGEEVLLVAVKQGVHSP